VACGAQAANNKLLVVETTGGEKVSFELATAPVITFEGQVMLITTSTQSQSFEIANVAQYYFDDIPVGVQAVRQETLRIRYAGGDDVVILGLQPADNVSLYAADGRAMPAAVSYNGQGAVISLAALQQGVYIISANNSKTVKIYKR